MHRRLIFIDNNFNSSDFESKCYTKITLEVIEPVHEFECDEEFKHDNRVDSLECCIESKAVINRDTLIKPKRLEIKFEILLERTLKVDEQQDQTPVIKYNGRISYNAINSFSGCKFLMKSEKKNDLYLANWCIRMFVLGSLEDGYKLEISNNKDLSEEPCFVIKKKLSGIFITVFFVNLNETPLNDQDMDIMVDLYEEFKLNFHYKTLITDLEDRCTQLKKDYEESVTSRELFLKTNENIRKNVEEIFIPMINEQRAEIRRLSDKLGIRQNLDFSSIKSGQLINYQEPNKNIQFDFDNSQISRYQKQIDNVSPKKTRGVKKASSTYSHSPTKPKKKSKKIKQEDKMSLSDLEEMLTDKDDDDIDLFPSLNLASKDTSQLQSSLQEMDSSIGLNEELNEEEEKKDAFEQATESGSSSITDIGSEKENTDKVINTETDTEKESGE